jgi:hypothetical protein
VSCTPWREIVPVVQFSLFGAEAAEIAVADLAGVLLAGGRWVRDGAAPGNPARLSVLVNEPWRAAGLMIELRRRGLDGEQLTVGERYDVRTGFDLTLASMAQSWTRGANQVPPDTLELTPSGLRLWAMTAGRHDEEDSYLLGTAEPDDVTHRVAGAQLARMNLTAVSIGARGGPGWRITSRKRLRRLAELLGSPPPGAGEHWPHP